jgi:hypothetical protein
MKAEAASLSIIGVLIPAGCTVLTRMACLPTR